MNFLACTVALSITISFACPLQASNPLEGDCATVATQIRNNAAYYTYEEMADLCFPYLRKELHGHFKAGFEPLVIKTT